MGAYIEAFILYIVIFFSGLSGSGTASFSLSFEVFKPLLFFASSIALIWYLLYRAKKIEFDIIRPGLKDLVCLLVTLPCLLVIGFIIAFFSSLTGSTQIELPLPSSIIEWIILCIFCLFFAYLEESFFRYYLLSKRNELNLNTVSALIFSAVLFSIGHIWEGPWGILNALVSGLVLGVIFLRFRSIHGIAIAHGMYNIAAYVVYSFSF